MMADNCYRRIKQADLLANINVTMQWGSRIATARETFPFSPDFANATFQIVHIRVSGQGYPTFWLNYPKSICPKPLFGSLG